MLEHTLIKNTNDSIKTFVVNNKLDEQGLSDFIKDNDLLESRMHIRPDKRDEDFIPLVGSTLEDEAIIVEVSPTNQFSYLTDIPNDSIKKEIKEAIKNLQKVDYPRRLLFYKQKRTSGKESWSHFNVPVSDARLFKEELTKTLSTLQDFKDRTRQLHYVLNDGVTNVDLNVYPRDDKSGMELVISLSKGQEEPYFYSNNIKIKEMSNEEFLNLIEDNLKTFKDVNDNDITKVKARRIEGKQSDTKISKSTILIPTYVTGIAPKGQVFTVSYLQFKPLETALKSKDVITNTETNKELPSFLSEEDENIAKFNAKMTAIADKEKAQISEEKTVKDFNSAFGAIWDEPTPTVPLVQAQEELPLQVGQFYVDAGLPKIIESISYDATTKDYIVNGEPFKSFTLNWFKKQQTKLEQDYNDSLESTPVVSDEEILNQLEEESNLSKPEKPVILEEESELTKLLKSLKVAGISIVKEKEAKLVDKGEVIYTKWLSDTGFKIGYDISTVNDNINTAKSIKSKTPTFNFVPVKPEDIQKLNSPATRVKNTINKEDLINKIKNCL